MTIMNHNSSVLLSALIIAKNEAKHIEACLQSVAFCDEIIVVDDESSDDTAKLARAKATVYTRPMQDNYAEQQNFAIGKAHGQWLLFIDCDERITPELQKEIMQVVTGDKIAYQIKRTNYFFARPMRYGVMKPDYTTRLIPKEGAYVQGQVHQRICHPYTERKLHHSMQHYSYDNWDEYYQKFERYTRLSASRYLIEGKSSAFILQLVLKPCWAFIKSYMIDLGFMEGKLGWALAVNHACYTYIKYLRFYYLKHPPPDEHH